MGASTPEYVAVIVLVGLVVAALTAAPIAPMIADWGRYAVCQLFGDDCERPVAPSDGAIPGPSQVSMVCLEGTEREQLGGDVTLFSAKVSGEMAYQIDRTSDGHHDVTLELGGGLAAELLEGGDVTVDGLNARAGKQGAIEVGGDATVAPVFRFTSQAAAVAFAEQARELVTGPVDDLWDWRTLIPVYGPGRIPVNQYRRMRDFQAPPPTRIRVEGSVAIEASGSAYRGGSGVEGVVSAGNTLGADFDLETGETTLYIALDRSVAGKLGLGTGLVPAGGGPSGSIAGEGDVTLALTLDRNNQPIELGVGATLTGHFGLGAALDGMLFDGSPFSAIGPDLDDALATFDLDARSEKTGALSASAALDLTDPRVGELGADLIAALASGEDDDLRSAGAELVHHLATQTDLEAQLHVGGRELFEVGASGGHALAFGFGVAHEDSSMELGGAWARPAGGHFQRGYCS